MKDVVYIRSELYITPQYSVITGYFHRYDDSGYCLVNKSMWKFPRWKFFVGESSELDIGKCHLT